MRRLWGARTIYKRLGRWDGRERQHTSHEWIISPSTAELCDLEGLAPFTLAARDKSEQD